MKHARISNIFEYFEVLLDTALLDPFNWWWSGCELSLLNSMKMSFLYFPKSENQTYIEIFEKYDRTFVVKFLSIDNY